MTERNKQKVRLFVEAVLNDGRLELIEELVAADFVGHLAGVSSPVIGAPQVQRLVSSTRSAYPDLYVKVEEQIAEDDQVVVRWRATGTPGGTDSQSGRRAGYAGVSIVRFLAGKQVDSRTECAPVYG